MNAQRLLFGFLLVGTPFLASCLDQRVVAPDDLLPPALAIDRPTVQLFRFARGRKVESDTVRITNNGEGPLGVVEQVGGVDYITTARTGWLDATIINVGDDAAILVLRPTYAEDEQDAADVAEVVLKGQGSTELKRVRVIARTLRGASFEFSVSPVAFAAVPGDPSTTQPLTVRNGGNGTLSIHQPTVRYAGTETGWLTVNGSGGSETSPQYEITADPGSFGGGLFEAFLVFESVETEETRAKPDSVSVQLNIGQPVLDVSSSSLVFSVIRGAAEPSPQEVVLSNSGEGPFEALGDLELGPVTYGEGAEGWLGLTLSGTQVLLVARSGGLDAGDYQASFPVTSVNGGTKSIEVGLSVEAPVLTPSSRTVSFGMMEGDGVPPAPQSIGLTNTGAGTFNALGTISLGSPTPSATWLRVELAGDAGDRILLTPTSVSGSLSAGDYTTLLPVSSQYGGSDTLSVTLSVSRGLDPPQIALSALDVEFSGISGDPSPSPQEVLISNAGGGTLGALSLGTISYVGPAGWLSASLAGSTITLTPTIGTLPDGNHQASVPVVSANGGSSAIDVTFAIGSPILTGSATSASFSAVEGGGNPSNQTITFTNTGPGSFSSLGTVSAGAISYSGAGGWLAASYAAGTLTLSVTTGSLGVGTYGATVPVDSDEGGSVSITVSFTVTRTTDAADLVASPSTVRMDATRGGGDPPSQTVLLSNGGGGSLGTLGVSGITYGAGASGWLSASLAGSTVTLDATTGSLAAGSFSATVGLTSASGGNESVDVTFVVAAPTLTLSSASASFSGEEGGSASPGSITIGVSNTGAGSFSSLGTVSLGTTAYSGAGGWLTTGLGGSGSTVDLSATIGGLGAGTYSATVPVNSSAGGNQSIGVTLTVTPEAAPPAIVLSATGTTFYAAEGGGDPASQNISISNGGGGGAGALGALSLGAISYGSGAGWLSASLGGSTVTLSPTTGALTAAGGPYTATVPVQSAAGGNQDVTVTFNISAGGAPTDLAVSPGSVRMDAVAGGGGPPDQDVLLYNSGSGSLGSLSVVGISYGSGAGWLSASLGGATLTLAADPSGLAVGSYDATVEVSSVGGGNEDVDVTFQISGPVLTLSSSSASFSGEEGGAASPSSVSVDLSNTGAGDFSSLGAISLGATTYGGPGGWLTAALAGGDTRVDLSVSMGALGPGTYDATVPVNSGDGGSGSLDVTLSVSRASDAPTLALSASSVDFTALLGGSSPASKSVSLSNSGGGTVGDLGTLGIGTITYGGAGTGWLSTSTLVGSTLTLSPVTGGLGAGTHTATVPVTSQFGGNLSVSVTLDVGSPVLTASTLALSFTGLDGGAAPAGQTVTFSNTGAGTFSDLGSVTAGAVSYGAGGSGWLVSPTTGASAGGGSLSFGVDQAGLAPGSYSATVPVSSQYGGSQSVSVTLSVVRESDPPDMVLSATTQRFDALVGGSDPPSQSVVASNVGGGVLGAISAGSPSYGSGASGWLTVSVVGTTVTTRARTGSLSDGTYTASVTITSAMGGSEQLDVTFILGASRLTLSPRNLSFGDSVGGPGPEPAMVGIANTGGGSYTSLGSISLGATVYGDGASDWLGATLTSPDSIQAQAFTEGLISRPAPYEAWVPVSSTLGGDDTVHVSFSVAPGTSPPVLSLSLDSLTFAAILGAGAPPAQTVTGFNSGGGELGSLSVGTIEYSGSALGWLSGAVAGVAITFQADVEGVPSGTHRASVTISSEEDGESVLEVALVLAAPLLSLSSQAVTFSDTVGSPDTLQTQVFISNTGAGNRASLGPITLGTIDYSGGLTDWLVTIPGAGESVEGFQVGIKGSAFNLPEGNWVALVPVESQWGGADTLAVNFLAREPDRSFDLPSIELVRDSIADGQTFLVPLPGDSVVVGPVPSGPTELGVRVKVRNGSATRVNLSGLRVGIPSYPQGEAGGWITGAFLDRTTATFEEAAELFVVVVPDALSPGRYEGRLVVSSESAGLEEVLPRVLRVVLIVS